MGRDTNLPFPKKLWFPRWCLLPVPTSQTATWLIFFLSSKHDLLRARDILNFTCILNERRKWKSLQWLALLPHQDLCVGTWSCLFICRGIPYFNVFFQPFIPIRVNCTCPLARVYTFHHPLAAYGFKNLEARVWVLWESYLLLLSLCLL